MITTIKKRNKNVLRFRVKPVALNWIHLQYILHPLAVKQVPLIRKSLCKSLALAER